VISSVHAFASGAIGPFLLAYLAAILLTSLALIVWRWDRLGERAELDALLSRESMFLVNNVLLVAFCLTVFLGTIFPLFAEAVTGAKVSVGTPYFNWVSAPILRDGAARGGFSCRGADRAAGASRGRRWWSAQASSRLSARCRPWPGFRPTVAATWASSGASRGRCRATGEPPTASAGSCRTTGATAGSWCTWVLSPSASRVDGGQAEREATSGRRDARARRHAVRFASLRSGSPRTFVQATSR
jgi:hypothetical protein